MCPLTQGVVHLEIYPIDKPAYVFKGVSCSIVFNTKNRRKYYNHGIEYYAMVKMNEVCIYILKRKTVIRNFD